MSSNRSVECHRNPINLICQKISGRTSWISKKRATSKESKVSVKVQVTSFYIKITS